MHKSSLFNAIDSALSFLLLFEGRSAPWYWLRRFDCKRALKREALEAFRLQRVTIPKVSFAFKSSLSELDTEGDLVIENTHLRQKTNSVALLTASKVRTFSRILLLQNFFQGGIACFEFLIQAYQWIIHLMTPSDRL